MFTKLEEALSKYEQIGEQLANPEIVSNQKEYLRYMREHKAMTPLIEKYKEYKKALSDKEDAQLLMSDPEMKDLAELEYYEAKSLCEKLEE